MTGQPSDETRDLSSLGSGDRLGDLMSPAASAPSGSGTSSKDDSGIDAELAEIMASVESVEPVGGASALEIPDEQNDPGAPGDDFVDSDGVLTIDLPDEAPPEISLDSTQADGGPRARRSAPTPRQSDERSGQAARSSGVATDSPGSGADGEAAAAAQEQTPEEADEPAIGRRRRRRRNPFENMEQASSAKSGMAPKDLMTLSDLKRIKRARVRHDGQRVITDDVKKLKSLTIEPHLPPGEYVNYYVEPVRIEYYIPKESRFAVETRFLYINLIDPDPRPEADDAILKAHIEQNRFIDIVDIMNEYPMYITDILESYNTTMGLYESLSRAIQEADEGEDESYRKAFYLCEVLMDYEPTMASLSFLGDFLAWNINWLIRAMNSLALEFAASDKTISYLIKKRNAFWEEHNLKYDERFETLAALFFEQAFPNRGLEDVEDDYFYDIFDKKFTV
ncbi:MAG: hypothetical protein RIF32_21345 [Leptospirales bacterium]|jgi:hypothetical protein